MNGVKETKESIKKKLSMDDYPLVGTREQEKKTKAVETKKIKMTLYLPEEVDKKLTKFVYSKKMEGMKIDRSTVVTQALQLFFEKEEVV